jgi:hypothetical protein
MLYIFANIAATSERFVMGIFRVVPGRTARGGASGMSGSTFVLVFELPLPMLDMCVRSRGVKERFGIPRHVKRVLAWR